MLKVRALAPGLRDREQPGQVDVRVPNGDRARRVARLLPIRSPYPRVCREDGPEIGSGLWLAEVERVIGVDHGPDQTGAFRGVLGHGQHGVMHDA